MPTHEHSQGKEALTPEQVAPCPFCGSSTAPALLPHSEIERREDLEDDEGNTESYAICCDFHAGGCGATGGYEVNKEDALERWNTRVSQ